MTVNCHKFEVQSETINASLNTLVNPFFIDI
jgi:hypothetical protein